MADAARHCSPLEKWMFLRSIALDPELTDSAKIIAFWLLDHMNGETGACYPSLSGLANRAGVDRSTAQRAIKSLEQRGWFTHRRGGPDGTANQYQACWDRQAGEPVEANQPIGSSAPRGSDAPSPIGASAYQPIGTSAHLISEVKPVNKTSTGKPAKPKKRAYEEDPHFTEFWAIYPPRLGGSDRKPAALWFTRHVRNGVDPQEIIRGAKGYAAVCDRERTTRTRFVKTAEVFLSKESWRTYLDQSNVVQLGTTAEAEADYIRRLREKQIYGG